MANEKAMRLNSTTGRDGGLGRGGQTGGCKGDSEEEQTVSEMEFHYGGAHAGAKGRVIGHSAGRWKIGSCACVHHYSFIEKLGCKMLCTIPGSDGHCTRSSQWNESFVRFFINTLGNECIWRAHIRACVQGKAVDWLEWIISLNALFDHSTNVWHSNKWWASCC